MKFSIIVPAYNAAGRIRRALDSITSQTYTDYELIVVCDSCEDDTEEIAKSYGAKTIAVDYHLDGLTRNAGIEAAQGDWILFMDDDDWWLHEYVLEMLAGRVGKECEDILCFSFIWKHRGYAAQSPDCRYIAVWNKCWRRSFINQYRIRFPAIPNWSDAEFNRVAMGKYPHIVYWDTPFYYYNYLREGSICYNAGWK